MTQRLMKVNLGCVSYLARRMDRSYQVKKNGWGMRQDHDKL